MTTSFVFRARRAARGPAPGLMRLVALVVLVLAACQRETRAEPIGAKAATPATKAKASAAAAPAPAAPAKPAASAGGATGCAAEMAPLGPGRFSSRRGGEAKLGSFCLDRTEVTAAAYQACVDAGKCTEPDPEAGEACNWKTSGDPREVKRGRHPINCIDQAQAAAYCAAQGLRLPSADELEWAQRGGDAATPFPWGDDELPRRVCSRANKNPDYPRAPVTCPVGSCPSGDSPDKIQDLSGNVAEWTSTVSPKAQDERLICGGQTSCQAGSINRVSKALAAGSCLAQSATAKFEGVGFRCARSR
jgi:formylglycine-generating enzyme